MAAPQTNGSTAQKTIPLAQPSRMRLDKLVIGKQSRPKRVTLAGPEGVGKSTFGAGAPKPIFLGTEEGTALLDVTRFPTPESWTDVLDAVRTLTLETHDFQTLVLDTLDWLEPMLWADLCRKHGVASIEDIGDTNGKGGFGKGYTAALDSWRVLLSAIERLRTAKNMHVIFLAHTWIKPFKNPEGPDYDRYEMKLNNKASGLVKEWCDALLFANFETFALKEKTGQKRIKGVSSGARVIYTERSAAYDAKNRYSLPASLPLSWADFNTAAEAGAVADPANLKSEITRKAKLLGGDTQTKILETMTKAGDNPQSLALINNRVNARLSEREQEQEQQTTTNNTAQAGGKEQA
jgi:hypothetical protein